MSETGTLSEVYQILANALITTCPPGFTEGRLVVALDQGYSEIRYDCVVDNLLRSGLPSPIENDLKVDEALHEIRQQMTEPGAEPWSKCTFTLFADGTFKFEVDYDDQR